MTSPHLTPVSLALACPADSFWERWCRNASPEQKQQILPTAIRSGLVQMHHLPVPGLKAARNAIQNLIASIVANRPPSLEPVVPDDVQFIDGSLDDDQRHAVAVAISSPDLSLILGRPGSGKSCVIAEILRQAVARTKRILFVAPTGAPLDRVIDRSADLAPRILRCSGAGETLPPQSARLSLRDRIQHFDRQTLPAARHQVEESKCRLALLTPLENAWPRLRTIPALFDALTARRIAFEQQRQTLAAVVEKEWSSALAEMSIPEWADLPRQHPEAERWIETRLRQLGERLGAVVGETARLGDEHATLTCHAEARAEGRWWTSSFWKAYRQPDPSPRLAELDRILPTYRAELVALEQERATIQSTRQHDEDEYAARCADLCRAEVLRRDADLSRELHDAAGAMAALEAEWAAVLPGEIRPHVVEAAERSWRDDYTSASQELSNRQVWLAALEQARPGLAFDLVVGARILAAPAFEVLALGGDRSPGAFDLLIIDDAHRLPEKDLLALARLAPRCVLVGEPGVTIPKPQDLKRVAGVRPDSTSTNVFLRLWAALHADPIRVSTTWTRPGDRLVARLHPFGPEDEARIDREPVFDRPEIELAIRTPPGADPHIVEVSFPASMRLEEAKDFLFRESGDLSIQSSGPGFRWREAEDGVHLHLGAYGATGEARVVLDAGIVEHLGHCDSAHADDSPCQTLGLSFARADGWNRDSATNWVAERLGLRDVGRTACLGRVYRARPLLASFLSELLFPRQPASSQASPACDGVEFVTVPNGEHKDWTTPIRNGGSADASPHSNGTDTLPPRLARHRGAGLEVDLGDPRRLDAIGADLRAALPPRGIINMPEARLVVQTLEAIALDSLARASFAPVVDPEPQVALLSLHPAQVELLRLLVRQSTVLAESGLRILVGQPAALAHRECPLVCLSLTRSHSSRAVPFSDDPRDLVLALTRASERLIVFGDPGTMVRRSQWFGSLDHLTETTGPVEQAIIARILTRLTERENPTRLVH